MRRKLKLTAILFFCVISGYVLGSAAYLLRFPSEIHMTEFSTFRLNISVPLSATFQEAAAVSKVNDTPVSELSSVRLGRPISITTEGHGTAEIIIGAFGFPFRRITLDVVPEVEIVPLGHAIGVRINTDGVMVLGTSAFPGVGGESKSPSQDLLLPGDLILEADGNEINRKEDLGEFVAASDGEIVFTVRRDGNLKEIAVTPALDAKYDVLRLGAWVRDSTKGIGTLTFFDPQTSEFAALGHGILDVDTKKLLSVRSGNIMPSTVTDVTRGMRGAPGELEGTVDTSVMLGTITGNYTNGIFGEVSPNVAEEFAALPRYPIARRAQIQEGAATVRTNVGGTEVKEYEIRVEAINLSPTDETKAIVIRITDPALLEITGGIVQGMSGSPIIQNGRIIGAITHVFVQDPTKGYAIFIESMLRHSANPLVKYTKAA